MEKIRRRAAPFRARAHLEFAGRALMVGACALEHVRARSGSARARNSRKQWRTCRAYRHTARARLVPDPAEGSRRGPRRPSSRRCPWTAISRRATGARRCRGPARREPTSRREKRFRRAATRSELPVRCAMQRPSCRGRSRTLLRFGGSQRGVAGQPAPGGGDMRDLLARMQRTTARSGRLPAQVKASTPV